MFVGPGEESSRELCPPICNNKIDLQFLNTDKFSDYKRLLNIAALVLRFINNLQKNLNQEEKVVQRYVTTKEYSKAEHLLLVFIQQDVTKINDYKQLEKDLNLQKDDKNTIRCRERLKKPPMKYDAKYPIILPKNSKFTELVIKHYHKLVLRNDVRETLNQIRTKFRITKTRNYIRRIIKKCVICNCHERSPFQYPAPPDLPSYRLSDKSAFTYSAVDYAGPLYVNNIYGKLQTFKFWIVLFTCASTRCIYPDLFPDCSSSSCVRVIKMFFAARGVPTMIISDNGSQSIFNETQSFVNNRGTK